MLYLVSVSIIIQLVLACWLDDMLGALSDVAVISVFWCCFCWMVVWLTVASTPVCEVMCFQHFLQFTIWLDNLSMYIAGCFFQTVL